MNDEVWGQLVDVSEGEPVGSSIKLYGRSGPDSLFFRVAGADIAPVPGTSFFVLALTDRRATDDSEVAYLDRVLTDPALAPERNLSRVTARVGAPAVGVILATNRRSTDDAQLALAVLSDVSRSYPVVDVTAVSVGAIGEDTSAGPVEELTNGEVAAQGAAGNGIASFTSFDNDAASGPRVRVHDVPRRGSADGGVTSAFGDFPYVQAVTATATSGQRAAFVTSAASRTASFGDLWFVRLDCSE